MGKSKEYSVEIRQRIIHFHKRGSSLGGISRRLKIPKQSVATIIRKYKTCGLTQSLPRSGRPPKLSPALKRKLVWVVRNNPKTTKKQLCGELQGRNSGVVVNSQACFASSRSQRLPCEKETSITQKASLSSFKVCK